MKEITSSATMEAALYELGIINELTPDTIILQKVAALQGKIQVSAEPKTNLLTVSAKGPDAENLPLYVNAIILVYERLEREWTRREDDEVIAFLEERIDYFRSRLQAAERATLDYRRDHLERGFTGDIERQIQRRSDLNVEAASLREKILELENQIERQAWRSDPAILSLQDELNSLIAKRDALRKRYTDVHPDIQELLPAVAAKTQELKELKESIRGGFGEKQALQIVQAESRLAEIERQFQGIDRAIQALPEEEIVLANLRMEHDLSRSLYEMFWQRLEQQKIKRQSKSGGVVPKGAATEPVKVYPNDKTQYTISIAIALLFGFAAGILWEILDTSIRTIEEVEEFVKLPVLGVVPNVLVMPEKPDDYEPMPGMPVPGSAGTIVHYEPRDPVTEAVRALASSLEFTFFNEGHRVLLLASATPQEGKTTTAASLSIALANAGRKVLLIDANLRHPGISKLFNLSGHAGLAEVLEGRLPWKTCVYPTAVEHLDLMPTGSLTGKPVELLKKSMPDLLKEFSLAYEGILIDSPPILPVADSTIISAMAGGTLIIYSQGQAPRDVLIRAKAKLETAKGRPIGLVLNKVRPEGELGQNYYYYYYSYYPSKGGGRRRGSKIG